MLGKPNPAELDRATLLGLYHGYDEARRALAALVARFGRAADTDRRLWQTTRREFHYDDLYGQDSSELVTRGEAEEVSRGAHLAALSAFATISDQAEQLLSTLSERHPELLDFEGGPLPTRRIAERSSERHALGYVAAESAAASTAAIASISTAAPSGKATTPTVARAGVGSEAKYSA